MSLTKPLNDIIEHDLQNLVVQQENEGRNLDYKKMLLLKNPKSAEDFRKDVSAFANSTGGDLIIGIAEEDGTPQELCGFDLGPTTPEQYQNALVEILQSRVKPRVQGIAIRVLPLANGKSAAIIRVPKSFARPHQIEIGNKDFQFWFRHDRTNQRMDIDELRNVILSSEALTERLRSFRTERLGNIVSGQTPIALLDCTKIVMHLVPLNAFEMTSRYELAPLLQSRIDLLTPIYGRFHDAPRHNFDGLLAHDKWGNEVAAGSYVQVFGNGVIESVEGRLFSYSDSKGLDMTLIEEYLYHALERYLKVQQKLGVSPPAVLMLSLLGISGYYVAVEHSHTYYQDKVIHEDNLLLPEEVIDNLDSIAEKIMKPLFDRVWNAAGWAGSMNYNADGNRR